MTAEAVSPVTRDRSRLWIRRLVSVLLVLVLLLVAALAAGAWYFSGQILDAGGAMSTASVRVLRVGHGTVELQNTVVAARPGIYGLDWPGGHAVLGSIVSGNSQAVVRTVSGSTAGLRAGSNVALEVYVYRTPAAVHLTYRTVEVPDPLGPMPAWYIPGRRTTWVILVHGYKAERHEAIRPMPALVHLGFPVLDLSYRNDKAAPPSPDHLFHLGLTEWRDVQAGVRYALAHGARSVVLYGYSMGGGTVEDFMRYSPLAPRVRAVVLDSPALDWSAVLTLAGEERHLPGILIQAADQVTAWRLGLSSLDTLNNVTHVGPRIPPTLLYYGIDDTLVPTGPSRAFVREHRTSVVVDAVPYADHTEPWNVDPKAYTETLQLFLQRVISTGG